MFEVSVSKRTTKLFRTKLANAIRLNPSLVASLEHRMVVVRVPTSGAKGQDQRGRGEGGLRA